MMNVVFLCIHEESHPRDAEMEVALNYENFLSPNRMKIRANPILYS